MGGELKVYVSDSLVCFTVVVSFKRRTATTELKCQNAKAPDINVFVMGVFLYHLWRKVIKSSTKSVSSLIWCVDAPSEVSNFDGALQKLLQTSYQTVQEVLRLDVSVNDIF